jgi:imidazolonepropionase-like amidohydrolase
MQVAKMLWLILAVSLAPAIAQQQKIYALKAARMFDSLTGSMIQPGLVIVADGKVQSISQSAIPSGATIIDLHDATLLPGFIDAHTHLTFDFDPDYKNVGEPVN